jgi:hypothetical protein
MPLGRSWQSDCRKVEPRSSLVMETQDEFRHLHQPEAGASLLLLSRWDEKEISFQMNSNQYHCEQSSYFHEKSHLFSRRDLAH